MDSFLDILSRSSRSLESVAHGRNSINFLICSAFEDFETERRILNNTIFPKLRTECFNEYGIEINLIDLKLGLDARHEITDSYRHVFTESLDKYGLCDPNNCPIFLFGQKYGRPQIPIRIPMGIYELFKKTLRRYKSRFEVDAVLLDRFYKVNNNSSNTEMILLTPREIFPQIYSKDAAVIKEAIIRWTKTALFLSNLFKNMASVCLNNGSLDFSTAQTLLPFELDTSVSKTLRRSLDSNFQPIVYSREIIDIKNFIVIANDTNDEGKKVAIEKLIDVVFDHNHMVQIDYNNQVVLDQLIESCLEIYESLDPPARILWRDDSGVVEEHHGKYIEEMVAFFEARITEAVRERAEFLITELPWNMLKCFDIVCDASLQVKRLAKFCSGFEEIVSTLLAYIGDESENMPLFLYGPINSGKAIVLAKTIHEFQQTNYDVQQSHVITRFGNPDVSLDDIMLSIYYQLKAIIYNQMHIESPRSDDLSIPKDLDSLLRAVDDSIPIKFVIILHDLEKSKNQYSTIGVEDFIPKIMPTNVKLIVTTSDDWNNRQLEFLNISIPEFSVTEYNNFIQTQLSHEGRILSQQETENLLQPYLKVVGDIFSATLVVNLVKKYRSFDVLDSEKKYESADEILRETLKLNFELYGEVLITHIITLIHCSNGGLTNEEIIDMLTMDNHVYNEMKILHPSALIFHEDTVRFPLSLFLLIRNDLSTILVERFLDGYLLVDLTDPSIFSQLQILNPGIDLEHFKKLLAEYYLGSRAESKQGFSDQSKNVCEYFCLPRQQLTLSKTQTASFYNYRKLRQLAFHLVGAKMNDKLLEEVIFNFDWLYYKIKSLGISELLEDFKYARGGSKEIVLLEESFRNSAAIIDKDLDSLAGELIGQLLPYVSFYPNLRLLIENCDSVAPKHNSFIPIYASNKLPGSPLASTIGCLAAIESVKILKDLSNGNDELLLKVKGDCNIYFYDLDQGQIASNILVSHGIVYFGRNAEAVFVLESKFRQIIKVHKRQTGDLLGQIIPMNWIVPRPFENKHEYRITAIDIGATKAALIITNEVSYLFIVSLGTFEPILAFNPGVKLQMLKLSVDETKVFSHHGEKLISFEIATNKTNSAVELQGSPIQMIFSTAKYNKAFIICEEQKGVIVLELDSSSGVNKCYKISFDNCLDNDDYVKDVSCSRLDNAFLLIRSSHSVLLYDWKREKVLCHVTRPVQLPIYFKLPNQHENQPASLKFNAAVLILEDRVLACSLFRDVIMCSVSDNRVLTTLHAPVGGIVSELFVTDQFLIGRVDQNDDAAEIMIWRLDTSSLFSKIETLQDRLTKSVMEIHAGPSVAIAMCDNSDEMGVIEVSTGTLVDLYSHASKVVQSCLSICGKYALVTVDNSQNSNILWSLESRKIILEFGSSINTVFLVPLHSVSGFLCITNYSVSIDDPLLTVTQINCDERIEVNGYNMKRLDVEKLRFVSERPCLLNGDRVLVALSNDYQKEENSVICHTLLTIWTREHNCSEAGSSVVVTAEDLARQIGKDISKIVSVKSSTRKDNKVIIMCCFNDGSLGCLSFDYTSYMVVQFIELNKTKPKIVDFKSVHLSNSGIYLFDESTLSIVDLNSGICLGAIIDKSAADSRFRCFVLSDTIIILSHGVTLTAWRVPDFTKIGQVELRDEVTSVAKCADDFTLLVGCQDGSILSYAVVDVYSPFGALSKIKVVRNFRPLSKSPTIQLESADALNQMSTKMSLEFVPDNVRRPMSDPVVGLDRREFSQLF